MSLVMSSVSKPASATFALKDPLLLNDQLSEGERLTRDTARRCHVGSLYLLGGPQD
jgi:hypothetical protein